MTVTEEREAKTKDESMEMRCMGGNSLLSKISRKNKSKHCRRKNILSLQSDCVGALKSEHK